VIQGRGANPMLATEHYGSAAALTVAIKGLPMPSSQLKRAEHAIHTIRAQAELPPEAADALQELVDVIRTIEGRLSQLEGKGRPRPSEQMELPNRQSK
jgi:uncharacterized membrane protein YccC